MIDLVLKILIERRNGPASLWKLSHAVYSTGRSIDGVGFDKASIIIVGSFSITHLYHHRSFLRGKPLMSWCSGSSPEVVRFSQGSTSDNVQYVGDNPVESLLLGNCGGIGDMEGFHVGSRVGRKSCVRAILVWDIAYLLPPLWRTLNLVGKALVFAREFNPDWDIARKLQ
jgi:hypothetical protein